MNTNNTNTIKVAVNAMYAIMTSKEDYTGKTPEWLQSQVIDAVKKELQMTDLSLNESAWKQIARTAYSDATKTPMSFVTLNAFCCKNPSILSWLHTTCGNKGVYNFVAFYYMCGINNGLVLTGKNTLSKEEITKLLTEKTNEFLAECGISWTLPSDYIYDNMLMHIVTVSLSVIKETTPEVLETMYTSVNKANKMVYDQVKESVDTYLTAYFNSMLTWPINNPTVAEPATV